MKDDKRTKRQTQTLSDKNSRRQRKTVTRRTDERIKKPQNKTKTDNDKNNKNSPVTPDAEIQQTDESMEQPRVTRLCAGHGLNPNCAGFLDANTRSHRKWCSEACRMYVNYKTRPQFRKKQLANKKRPNTPKNTQVVEQIPDEVTRMVKDNPGAATWSAAQKALTGSKDPLLNFVGNNGELIVNVVKEFFSGFVAAKQATAQAQQQIPQQIRPHPPDGYGTLRALQFKNDPHWTAQAQAWERYLAGSPHGQVDVSRPQPTQYSVQPGASAVESSGARTLKDVANVSRVLDAQSQPINTRQESSPTGLTPDEMQKLDEYRKENDPLKHLIKKSEPVETEVNTTNETDQALISEKLQMLINLFNGMSDETIKEFAKKPDEAIRKLDEAIKKPLISMFVKPYLPVIKDIGINEFKQVFENNCKEKLSSFTPDEIDTFLVKLDAWRQNL